MASSLSTVLLSGAIWVAGMMGGGAGLAGAGAAEGTEAGGGANVGRMTPVEVRGKAAGGFTLLGPEVTGVGFTNVLAESRYLTNQMLLNGGGVAAGDVDGDGWCDLFFCGLDNDHALYRNLGGWRFEDVTGVAGVACAGMNGAGAALVDLDGDGDLDLVVTTLHHGTHGFWNDGRGRFREAEGWAMRHGRKGNTSLALGDLDGDGDLDLYVANYRFHALSDMPGAHFSLKTVGGQRVIDRVDGRPITEPDLANRFRLNAQGGLDELGEEDDWYENQGGTNLVRRSFTDGSFLDEDGRPLTEPLREWGLSVMIRDLNGDGRPDIYVCNDFDSPDRQWLNLGKGRFRLLPRLALRQTSLYAMGVDCADVNRDGRLDIFVIDMLSREHARRMNFLPDRKLPVSRVGEVENRPQYSRNTLSLNRGDGTYAEIAQLAGVQASEWSWNAIFLDADLDGWEDLLIANGHERDARNMDVVDQLATLRATRTLSRGEMLAARRLFPRQGTANAAFRNRGDLTFEEVAGRWGFDRPGVSQGMCLADLDNDGDLDVAINNLNDSASLLRNESAAPRVAVRLRGRAPNTRGIGARVRLLGGAVPVQEQEILAGGRYLSSDEPMRVFAAGSLTNRLTLEVVWPNGARTTRPGVAANAVYELEEQGPPAVPERDTTPSNTGGEARVVPLFADASGVLGHRHSDQPFDDFERQPLLPRRLSQGGPGVSWVDVNGDGWDDLVVPSGKGGAMALFMNDGAGNLVRVGHPTLAPLAERDQTALVEAPGVGGKRLLLVGSSNHEDGLADGACVRQLDLVGRTATDLWPGRASSTGPLALADMDADGDLDLVVGGRSWPGRYPAPASSLVLRQEEGKWTIDTTNSSRLAQVGMVSGVVWTDLDADGWPELVLACEWGPVRVMANRRGLLEDRTEAWGLAGMTGWWNGVTAGDLDGDGRMDLVASNWGRNHRYQAGRDRPLRIYYAGEGGEPMDAVIEAHFEAGLGRYVPWRLLDSLAPVFPFLQERYPSRAAFAAEGVEEALGERLGPLSFLEAAWLETTVFLNRGQRFEAVPLGVEAQMAPAFGISVADFNGDGREDVFLAQNFFATTPETPRHDAGRGLCLLGDPSGGWRALSGEESGVVVYGEQRGCAAADYDRDGRVDLAVGQNGQATRLFRNQTGRPGLRVRVRGGAGNPWGVGVQMRLEFPGGLGPMRECHAGSGYWSQDSAAQVLGCPEPPRRVLLRWPGGQEQAVPVAAGATEVTVARVLTFEANRVPTR